MNVEENPVIRACAVCQKEHAIIPAAGTSHGYCKRHLVAMWRELGRLHGRAEMCEGKIAALLARPEGDFPPDLGAALPAWRIENGISNHRMAEVAA